MKRIVFMIAVAGLLFAPHKTNAEGLKAGISAGYYLQRSHIPGPGSESVTIRENGWVIAPKITYQTQHKGGPQFGLEFEPQILFSRNIKHNHPGFSATTTTGSRFQLSTDATALNDLNTSIRNFYDSEVNGRRTTSFQSTTPWYRSGLLCRIEVSSRTSGGDINSHSACREYWFSSTPDNRNADDKYYFTEIDGSSTVREWVARTAVQNLLEPLAVPPSQPANRVHFDGNPIDDTSSAGKLGDWFYYYFSSLTRVPSIGRDMFNAYLAAVNDIPNQGGGDLSHITGDLNQWRLYMLMDLARRFNQFDETVDNGRDAANIFDNQNYELGGTVEAWLGTYGEGTTAEQNRILAAMRAVSDGDDPQLGGDDSQLPQVDRTVDTLTTTTTYEPAEINEMAHVILPVYLTVSKIAASGKLGGHLGVGTGVMFYNFGDKSPTVTEGTSWLGLVKAGFSGQLAGKVRINWEARFHQALSRPKNVDDVWGISGTMGLTVPF